MTYSIDIINLCFNYLHENKKKKFIASILKISINTINYWIIKYFNNYTNMNIITVDTIKEYKQNNIHKSTKRLLFNTRISNYVNNNKGCFATH